MCPPTYPRLAHLFGAFMHQDWDTEGKDWPDLVGNFAHGQPAAELEATANEVDRLLAEFPEDAGLNDQLYRELSCYYDPRPDLGGPTVRAWLGQVAGSLRQYAGPA
jgi:CdiI immunity protein